MLIKESQVFKNESSHLQIYCPFSFRFTVTKSTMAWNESEDLPWVGMLNTTPVPYVPPMMDRRPPVKDSGLEILQALMWYMHLYYNPSVAILGICCNILALVVQSFSELQELAIGHYILALLVAHTAALINVLLLWVNNIGGNIYRYGSVCHFTQFLGSTSAFLSVWYAVALCADGYIMLGFRTQAERLCQPPRAKFVAFAIAVVAVAVFLNISLTYGVINVGTAYICTAMSQFIEPLQTLSYIDIIVNVIIPYTAMLYLFTHAIFAALCCGKGPQGPFQRPRQPPSTVKFPLGLYCALIILIYLLDFPGHACRVYFGFRDLIHGGPPIKAEWDLHWQEAMNGLQHIKSTAMLVILLCSAQVRTGFPRIATKICSRLESKNDSQATILTEDNPTDDTSVSLMKSNTTATASV